MAVKWQPRAMRSILVVCWLLHTCEVVKVNNKVQL